MDFALKVWKLLVAIKDGLVLLFMLLFFLALYGALSARPDPAKVHDGALLIELNGVVVEELTMTDPITALISGQGPLGEYRSRDVVRSLELAAKDDRIKAVVLDLSGFLGAGQVHLRDIGDAIDVVRAADKPVLAYGVAYIDDGLLLAAHADEVWMHPMGGAFITGPGGNNLYFGELLKKLKIDAKVYRVGTFKSAVEPWTLSGPSDASRESYKDLYGAKWEVWKADYRAARPKVDIDAITRDPVGWLKAAGGDVAEADKASGIVDRIGSKTEFGMRVAEIAGENRRDKAPGSYAHTRMRDLLAATKPDDSGKAIAVVTIAGEIVDGPAGPGVAGGDRIAKILNDGLDEDYAALVLRVDSPGGSVVASEQIREAVARYADKDIPVVVSMANVAASGGYWVSTPARRIFADSTTITGSIGIFAILPTFDRALADWGITGGGEKTTPLSGQPDVLTGLAPEVSAMIQASIENGYREFIELVAESRKVDVNDAAKWAEGRPWVATTAKELGLVDEFGGLKAALAYAAKEASLGDSDWHAEFLGAEKPGLAAFLRQMQAQESAPSMQGADLAGLAARRQNSLVNQAVVQVERLFSVRGAQAYCLECPVNSTLLAKPADRAATYAAAARLFGLRVRTH